MAGAVRGEKTKMVEVDIDSLEPNPWNTNFVSPEHEGKLEESIKRFGVFKPVIVRELEDGRLQILGGEHRWAAAKRLGFPRVPIVNLGAVDEIRAKEIGLADNGRYGQDDPLGLAALLRDLGNADELSTFLPYSDIEFATILAVESINLDDLSVDDDTTLPVLAPPTGPTHQIMRFKVPVEDQAWISALIEYEMKAGGFTKEDSMTNAGNAFVAIMQRVKENMK
jgi:ParB family transcriptional regulator, chromosome partitioning protein